jgi:hypothetical protein
VIDKTGPTRRRRHWWRWIIVATGILVVVVYGGAALLIKLPSVLPPLALPKADASAPTGPLDGPWRVASGSLAGLRVQESALGFSNDVVGRTGAVNGELTVSDGRIIQARIRVGLTTMKFNGKTQPQFANSLGTKVHPIATITLSHPMTLGSTFASGATITSTAVVTLSLNGVSHPAILTIQARREGSVLQAVGSIPVPFATWNIKPPAGYGIFGSLANHGTGEFSLVLDRTGDSASA